MLTLLQPIWLLACIGIIVPIVIHLWHVKRGKTLQVGSLAFLQQSSKQQSTSLKITDWLLLLIRCLLIILLALLLAKPQWQSTPKAEAQKGWLVVDANQPLRTYYACKPVIDSLLANKYELHLLQKGFPKFTLADSNQLANDTLQAKAYWLLYNQLMATNASGYLFTDRQLQHFKGTATVIDKRFKWISYSNVDTTNTWLINAYATYQDSVVVNIANSTPSGTTISSITIAFKNGVSEGVLLQGQNISLAVKPSETITLDTATQVMAIYAKEYIEDAEYVKAALAAIKAFTKRKLQIEVTNNVANLPRQMDWLFWLSDSPVITTGKAKNMLAYQAGKPIVDNTWFSHTEIGITKAISNHTDLAIWQNGKGNYLLTINEQQPNIYKLYTHFNPSWNDLVWHQQFPSLLAALLYKEPVLGSQDKREIDTNIFKSSIENDAALQSFSTIITDISQWIWLLAFTLLLVERWLSFTTKNSNA
ncbi:BatA domain-containing protein [Parasediminibacterium paludis]|uniref:BatA domain-containing protein n=1 Tax=Parasediminibacterium paludis TaxID=908966 RepID=A0ABV8PWF3_9BACT